MTRSITLPALLFLAGCSMTPLHERPSVVMPPQFSDAPGWRQAAPADDAPRGPWWARFNDPVLNDLEARVATANQNVAAAIAAYDAARALVGQQRSALFPGVSATGGDTRSQNFQGNATTSTAGSTTTTGTDKFNLALNGSWTVDLFGQLRANLAQSKATSAASAADLGNVILAAQGQLALDYVQIRALDAQLALDEQAIAAYTRARDITQNRYNQGVVARIDVLQAETQLQNTKATATDVARQRAVLVHAIAVLVGENPSHFVLLAADWAPHLPDVPPVLPAQLLERRPDIAAAERRVAAANASIGAARSAYFPTVSLTASTSSTSSSISRLLGASTSLWSLGGTLAGTVVDFGGRSAKLRNARALHEQTVAQYRQTALTAFQQVEDQLSALQSYAQEEAQRTAASAAADRAEAIRLNQYKAGLTGYTDVITAQTTAFTARQAIITATSNRLQATVSLIQAIGGDWAAKDGG